MFAVGMALTPEMGAAVDAHIHRVRAALARWEADRTYFNFTRAVGRRRRPLPAGYPPAAARDQGALRPGGALPGDALDLARTVGVPGTGPVRKGRYGPRPCA